jgi:hypothetical protein
MVCWCQVYNSNWRATPDHEAGDSQIQHTVMHLVVFAQTRVKMCDKAAEGGRSCSATTSSGLGSDSKSKPSVSIAAHNQKNHVPIGDILSLQRWPVQTCARAFIEAHTRQSRSTQNWHIIAGLFFMVTRPPHTNSSAMCNYV